MISKLAFSTLLLLGVASGCNNSDMSSNNPSTQQSNGDLELIAEDTETDFSGMGHDYSSDYYNIPQDEEGYAIEEVTYYGENPPFELRIYSEIDQGLEASRYYSSKYGEGLYDNVPTQYNTHVSIISDYEGVLVIRNLIVNKGQSCPLIDQASGFLRYGEKTSREIHSCDTDQVRHMLVQTDIGDFEFTFQ